MKRSFASGILILLIALTNIGGCNVFGDMYDHNSDEAIAADIQKLIDGRLWNDAVDKWFTMTAFGQEKVANKVLLATAYAGRGKLDLIDLINAVNPSGGAPAGSLFTTLLTAYQGATISDFNDQVSAQNILLTISATASGRTTDQNVFLLFVELAKLGTLMAATGDLDLNGTVDPTYDNCSLSATQGAEVVTALGNINDILTVIGTSLVGAGVGAIQTACGSMGGACAVTEVANVTAVMIQAGKTIIGESNLGMGLAAPYNDPYCQLTNAPIDPTLSVPALSCPGGLVMGSGPICP